MQHTVGALLLSTFFGISALAAPPPPAALPMNAIVRLASPQHSVCGTGFIDENGYIVTNAHLIRSLCPDEDCSDFVVASASALDAAPVPRPLVARPGIVAVLPAFDLGFIDAQLPPSTFRIGGAIEVGDEVITLGFPGCETLEYSSGVITSTDPLHLTTTLHGGHGSSGSPIVNKRGEIVGIVDEAARFLDSVGGGPFALRGSRVEGKPHLEPRQVLTLQLERLAAFRRDLNDRSLTERIRGSFDLVVALDGLIEVARDLPPNDPVALVLSRRDTILSAPPISPTDPAALIAESLTIEYALQHHLSFRAPQLMARYLAALEKQGRSGAHLFSPQLVPTVCDLNAASLIGFAVFLLLAAFSLVRLVRFFRSQPGS